MSTVILRMTLLKRYGNTVWHQELFKSLHWRALGVALILSGFTKINNEIFNNIILSLPLDDNLKIYIFSIWPWFDILLGVFMAANVRTWGMEVVVVLALVLSFIGNLISVAHSGKCLYGFYEHNYCAVGLLLHVAIIVGYISSVRVKLYKLNLNGITVFVLLITVFSYSGNRLLKVEYPHRHGVTDELTHTIALRDAFRLFERKSATFVDARHKLIFQQLHIADAINIPLGEAEAQLDTLGLPKDQRLIVYCDNARCGLSYDLLIVMKNHGFSNVYHLLSGIDGWIESAYPTEPKLKIEERMYDELSANQQ